MEIVCLSILKRIDSKMPGYEANSGRYAGFFLGQYYAARGRDKEAKMYYELAVAFGNKIRAFDSGYYLYSLFNLGKMAEYNEDYGIAEDHYLSVKKYARRKQPVFKDAKEGLKRIRKNRRSKS
jgi:tetratricopeptide (TPR) repeat protein